MAVYTATTSSAPSTSTLPPARMQRRRVGACSNCYARKYRCDRGAPCQRCVRDGLHSTCSGGRGGVGISLAATGATLRKDATGGACLRCIRRKTACDRGQPCGECVRLGVQRTCRKKSSGRGGDGAETAAVAVRPTVPNEATAAVTRLSLPNVDSGIVHKPDPYQADTCRASLASTLSSTANSRNHISDLANDTTAIISAEQALIGLACYGDNQIGGRWPAIDEDVLGSLRDTLGQHGVHGLSDVQRAYMYALLAFCCVTLMPHHPFRRPNAVLSKQMMPRFIAAVEHFLDHHQQPATTTAAFTGTPATVFRMHFFLLWVYVHARTPKRAQYHLTRAVDVGHRCGLYTADCALLTPAQEQVRQLQVMELDLADVWIGMATAAQTCVPALPADVLQAVSCSTAMTTPVHSRHWRVWLLHMAKWARKAEEFVRQERRLLSDTTTTTASSDDALCAHLQRIAHTGSPHPHSLQCEQALVLLSEMECMEQFIFVPGQFPPKLIDDNCDDDHDNDEAATAARSYARELSLSVHYKTLMIKVILSGGALNAERLNRPLCSVALRTARDILAGVPEVVRYAGLPRSSQFLLDWITTVVDMGAGVLYCALHKLAVCGGSSPDHCRIQQQTGKHLCDGIADAQQLFLRAFDLLNAHCAATPMLLQVACLTKVLAVPRGVGIVLQSSQGGGEDDKGVLASTVRHGQRYIA